MTVRLSARATQTHDQPISYFMQQAVENPELISLAAGLVDPDSLPAAAIRAALDDILRGAGTSQAALQYGTTHGYAPLRDKVLARARTLDAALAQGASPCGMAAGPDDVIITTGSQQLLYMLGELLLDPGDIVITEAPSYFVYHSALTSLGARTLQVPMDEEGMNTNLLEEVLARLEKTGELDRVKLIYTIDYFQNPTGLTLSWPRRQHLMELVRRFSRKQRIVILEDAAYRELRFDGLDVPSIKSLDHDNAHVILAMTFSKPMAPGLKTGYGILPSELVGPLLRFKGNHDFGSSNLTQHLLDRLLANGAYERHVEHLREVYRDKRDALLEALGDEFGGADGISWTEPKGGMYIWLSHALPTGPDSRFMKAALAEGVLYVPGQFCYVGGAGREDRPCAVPQHEARLCYGVASVDQLREAVRRLGRATAACGREETVWR
jgi:2-aminoadipate transaminase